MVPRKVLRATSVQQECIEKEKRLGHHIPSIVVNKAARLVNVRHREELRRFAKEYRNKSFKDIEEEYTCVERSISNLIAQFFGTSQLTSAIKRSMRACLAAGRLEENYREHFIHPFQIFILGSIVIDKFYPDFQRWYDEELATSDDASLESAWFLAAIFHDRGKEINILRSILEPDIGPYGDRLPNEEVYLGFLSSFYEHISGGDAVRTWTGRAPQNSALKDVLASSSKKWAHGVKSSLLMLNEICNDPSSASPRDVAAAFAIAVHDRELWDGLRSVNAFPIRVDMFPLSCLLLYLDAIQEWGRVKLSDEEVHLVSISFTSDSFTCEVAFDNSNHAKRKLVECNETSQCWVSTDLELSLAIKVRLHSA
jgi:hypothetical protein